MKKLIIISTLLFSYLFDAQIKAVTDEGKEVVLFENGTWKFVNESDVKTLETITNNETLYTKDKNSTFLFRSNKINVGLYVNPNSWKIADAFKSPYIEYAFYNTQNNNTLALITTENIEIATLKNLKEVLISSVQNRADYFKLKESEYRNVNGLKVLYLRYLANSKGMDFEYQTYAYLSENGYCTATCYSTAKHFDELKPEMDKFINGLVEAKKAEKTEVYQSPPPPTQAAPKKKN